MMPATGPLILAAAFVRFLEVSPHLPAIKVEIPAEGCCFIGVEA
jgi:hypothetical protein